MTNKPKKLTHAEARQVKENLSSQIAALNEAIANIDRAIGAGENQKFWQELNKKKLQRTRDRAVMMMNSIHGEEA